MSSTVHHVGMWQVPEISLAADKRIWSLRDGVDKNSKQHYLIITNVLKY
jgi:hypothetical protein